MPSTPPAGTAVADPREGARARGTRATAPMKAPLRPKALRPRRTAAAGGKYRMRRVAEALLHMFRTSYYDP
jgi:hypothetical protein